MKTYRLIDKSVRNYVIDEEIIEFLKSNPKLNEIYIKIQNATTSNCVVILVSLKDSIKLTYDLNVIVRLAKKTTSGQYEYFLVENFINGKIDLYKLFETLASLTQIGLNEIIDTIFKQLSELGAVLDHDYHLITQHKMKKIYFERHFKTSKLN